MFAKNTDVERQTFVILVLKANFVVLPHVRDHSARFRLVFTSDSCFTTDAALCCQELKPGRGYRANVHRSGTTWRIIKTTQFSAVTGNEDLTDIFLPTLKEKEKNFL